jgi:cytochrome c-type biogenesis protein CcmH
MLFWLLFALMTGAAILAVLWPLGRTRGKAAGERQADLAVYRDQLAEIERDRARGLLPAAEAAGARIEVERRILTAGAAAESRPAPRTADRRRRAAAIAALAGIPILAIGLYHRLGSPELPDAPLASRLEAPPEQQDVEILVQRVERHLAENPDDGLGWEILAPVYLGIGRADDAVKARANALRLLGATAAREAALGEAIAFAEGGVVTKEARAAFERARALDMGYGKALYFLGLAAEQEGRISEAVAHWRDLADKAAEDDRWRAAALARIARHEASVAQEQKP